MGLLIGWGGVDSKRRAGEGAVTKGFSAEVSNMVGVPLVFGIGFHTAWVYATTIAFTDIFFGGKQNQPNEQLVFYFISVACLAVVSLLGYWIPFFRIRKNGKSPAALSDFSRLAVIGSAMVALSTACLAGAFMGGFVGNGLLLIAAVGTGIGSGLLMPLCWAKALGACNSSQVLASFSLAITFAFCLLIMVVHCPFPLSVIVVCLFPVAELPFLLRQLRKSAKGRYAPRIAGTRIRPVRLFVKIGVPSMLFGVILGLLQELSVSSIVHASNNDMQPLLVIGSLLASPVIMFSTVIASDRWGNSYARPLFTIVIVSLALTFSAFASSDVLLLSVLIAYVCFNLLTWAAASDIVSADGLPSLAVYTALRSCLTIGAAASVVASKLTVGLGGLTSGGGISLPLGLVVIFAVAMFFWPSRKDIDSCIVPSEQKIEDSFDDVFLEACKKVARQYSLSNRESEVLLFLAQGRDVAYISKTLFISINTVKSHRRHIYSKMDVHSQQSIIEKVSREHRALRGNGRGTPS